MNHALHPPGRDESRREIRVPTRLDARVRGGPTEKKARVYSLSVGGAFLETARVTPVGCEVCVEIALPSSCALLRAVVVHHNAPGNLERPALPHGMAVRFLEMEDATRKAISAYVEDRVRRYAL